MIKTCSFVHVVDSRLIKVGYKYGQIIEYDITVTVTVSNYKFYRTFLTSHKDIQNHQFIRYIY